MFSHLDRILADRSVDEAGWFAARQWVIGGSDAAKLSKLESVPLYLAAKLKDGQFHGNAFTRHGRELEDALLQWAGIPRNEALFHHPNELGFAATPDGIEVLGDGSLILAEVKTTNKPFKTIPLRYLRQVWWTQYVLGAEQTKFIWDQHDNFQRVDLEPHITVIDRDDTEIARMVSIATPLLAALRAARQFEMEMTAA